MSLAEENESFVNLKQTASGIVLLKEPTNTLDWYFPNVECGQEPLGSRVIIQLKRVPTRSRGGIQLVTDTKDTEKWNTQVARVAKIGPLAFCNRSTGEKWPEGAWVTEGEFVRVPRWGGDRWEVPIEGEDDPALFVVFNDHELISKVIGDPLKIKAFLL